MRAPQRPTSLSKTVPLFIGLLLIVVLGVASTIEYVQLRNLLTQINDQRMEAATTVVARLLSDQLASGAERLGRTADTLVTDLLDLGMEGGPAQEALAQERLSALASMRSLAVVDVDGSCIVVAEQGEDAMPPEASCAERVGEGLDGEGVVVGPLYEVAGEPRYRVAVPADAGEWSGRVVFEAALGSARGGEIVSHLIASDANLLLGNADGGLWTDLGAVVDGPGDDVQANGLLRFEDDDGVRVGATFAIAGTPWVALAHRSLDVVLAPSRTFLGWTAGTALLILLLSSLIGWWLSLRVTRPLAEVTEGAEALAGGAYGRRVSVDRNDEVGRLAVAFNAMAERVDDRRKTLEGLVAERTETLQAALARLEETQDELVRRERLATLGELAGGVGHELRNPLGVMTNALYYLEAINADAPYKVQEYMGILKSQVAISEKIVSDLLDFGRLDTPDRSEIHVEALVRRGLERRPVTEGISVEVDIPNDLPPVFVDPGHIDQVMVNLISNAIDAMEGDHGTLSFSASSNHGEHVTLQVSDTGEGIAADRLPRIFEPLVTTKAKGIGLGLAVSRLLASANEVALNAESEVGKGSTFELTFPVFKRGNS